ncbi:MAG TPA: SDR family oxidoreductase [Dehalococcoidia bacterium]|nr:SDR family oxidoreductase [Dehalococcoidia bacterium]
MAGEFDFSGQVSVVTGGGRGIGKTIALGLAEAGAHVAITGRSESHLEETAKEIESHGVKALPFPADVTDREAMKRLIAETEAKLGPVDIAVSNAAIEGPFGPMWINDNDAWKRCLETNVMGPFNFAQAVLPGMVERRRGRLINVGSGGGLWAVPYDTGYSTTKAALIRLTEGIAIEAEEFNVYAWVIHPGVVHTGMSDTVLNSPDGRKWLPAYEQALDRGKTPVEWASQLVNFLASGEADGLSGCFLSVNDDYRALAQRAKEIKEGDMHTLRLKLVPTQRPPRAFQR